MAYVPYKTISVVNNRLVESDDLTKTLSSFLYGDHYLYLDKDGIFSCISLNAVLTSVRNLDLTKPIETALNGLFTDLFVNKFKAHHIPQLQASGLYNKRLVVFNPLAYKNYKVYFTSINTPHIQDDITKKGYLDDLAIASDEDMTNFLVAVNGVFHRTTILDNVLYVLDGFRTIRLSGRKDIVIVDTKPIGGHTIVPITKTNATKSGYQKNVTITTPFSVQNKSVFCVIDGYFYHKDTKVLSVADNTHLTLHTYKLPLIQQFRHNPRTVYKLDRYGVEATQVSRKYIDLYDSIFLDNKTVPTELLANEEFQHSRVTHYHSFLVVMNNPNLFTVERPVMSSGTPKMYLDFTTQHLSGMLSYGYGLCPSYLIWKDIHDHRTVFLNDQDDDIDRSDYTHDPLFVPSLLVEQKYKHAPQAVFVDYVCS